MRPLLVARSQESLDSSSADGCRRCRRSRAERRGTPDAMRWSTGRCST